MKPIFIFVLAAIAVCVVALMTLGASRVDDQASPVFGTKIPPGYRDWKLISVAHEQAILTTCALFWVTM